MTIDDLATRVLDCAFSIHRELGPGLLESVYETILAKNLNMAGLTTIRQHPIPIRYLGMEFDEGFRADLVVCGQLIIELKSIQTVAPVHLKQLLTYLKLSGCQLGLLINFNEALLKHGIQRVANNYIPMAPVRIVANHDTTKIESPAIIGKNTERTL